MGEQNGRAGEEQASESGGKSPEAGDEGERRVEDAAVRLLELGRWVSKSTPSRPNVVLRFFFSSSSHTLVSAQQIVGRFPSSQ